MRGTAQHRLETAARSKTAPLAGGSFISSDLVNKQDLSRLTPKFSSALATADASSFANVAGSDLGRELQHIQCLHCRFAAHQIDHQARFLGRNTTIYCNSARISVAMAYFPFAAEAFSDYMTAEMAGWGKFTQAMANHVFSDIDRHMPAAIMDGDCVTHHLGEDRAVAAPGADDFLLAAGIHRFNFFQKLGVDERPFFQRS